jgi:hypothetical protein
VAEEALQLVRGNLVRNGLSERTALDETGAGVRLAQVDLFSPRAQLAERLFIKREHINGSTKIGSVGGRGSGYDILVCNPPYIPRAEYDALQPSVRLWEDRRALLGEYVGSIGRGEVEEGGSSGEISGHEQEDGLAFYRRMADVLDLLLVTPAAAEELRARDITLVRE